MFESGSTVSFQPVPTLTFFSRLNGVTAIGRRWAPGDTRRCRLCPVCTADHEASGCLIQTEDTVSDEDMPLYSFSEWGDESPEERRITPDVPDRLRLLAAEG